MTVADTAGGDTRPWEGWSDEAIVAELVDEGERNDGELPTIAEIRNRARVGSSRATRLREAAGERLEPVPSTRTDAVPDRVPAGDGGRTEHAYRPAGAAVPVDVPESVPLRTDARTDPDDTVVPIARTGGEYAHDQRVPRYTGGLYHPESEARTDEIPAVPSTRTEHAYRPAADAVPDEVEFRTDTEREPVPSTRTDHAGSDVPAERPRGRRLWWLFAAVGLGISAHTSWEFFTAWWTGSPWYLRAVLCFAIELGIIAASREMHVEAQAGRHARKAQLIAWSGCAVAFGMAVWLYAGAGLVFGAIGPVAAVIGLHSALGLELRNATGHQRGAVAAELVERVKARFGLADDDRDAARRIRDRHAVRAGRLAARDELGNWRTRQLRRAITKAEISRDARSREIMLAEQATLRGLEGLTKRDTAAPWDTACT